VSEVPLSMSRRTSKAGATATIAGCGPLTQSHDCRVMQHAPLTARCTAWLWRCAAVRQAGRLAAELDS
jgi:hypothetical protein